MSSLSDAVDARTDQQTAAGTSTKIVLPSIGSVVEGEDEGFSEIKHSLCMQCGGEGTTRMLMTKIPFFREVIISSFECETCSWSNNEVKPVEHVLHRTMCLESDTQYAQWLHQSGTVWRRAAGARQEV
jgi:ZPR1 zinc-finger domain